MITRDEAITEITSTTEDTSNPKEGGLQDGDAKRVEIEGRKEYFALRTNWSKYIARWITALIAFNVFLTLGVGFGLLDFRDMEWFVTAVIVDTFLQIIGMGYIAVKFLFSHK